MQEPIPYSTKTPPSPIVMCSQCGVAVERDQAAPIVAQAQVGEIVDMSRRWRCRDRESCDARGPAAQTVEQLRADLDAAEIVITSLKAKIESLRQERDEAREALEQISYVVNAPRTNHGANSAARLKLINRIVTDARKTDTPTWRTEEDEAREFERTHDSCDDPECPRHGYGEEE